MSQTESRAWPRNPSRLRYLVAVRGPLFHVIDTHDADGTVAAYKTIRGALKRVNALNRSRT